MTGTLTDLEIAALAKALGAIEPYTGERQNPASYNLGIGKCAKIETPQGIEDLDLARYSERNPFYLAPGGWILTDVEEFIRIPPDVEAQVILRSSAARRGWDHALAGFVDPGYEGRLTLEFVNCLRFHHLPIYPGLELVQLKLSLLASAPGKTYAATGRYQGADRVEGCKDPRLG